LIRKAVIPAAGFGTRFLPASKSIPKEMIPVVDKPTIQYVVEEAVQAGIEEILVIVSSGKDAIREHFAPHDALEHLLEKKGKAKELKCVRSLSDMAKMHYVHQESMRGLGDAIRYAKDFADGDPFAILLGDTVIRSHTKISVLQSMVQIHDKHESSVIALRAMPRSSISQYGVISGKAIGDRLFEIDQLVEKPDAAQAPSLLAVSARYIVTSRIFEHLEGTRPGFGGEIQITDALNTLAQREKMLGFQFEGERLDIGNKLEFIKSNVIMGLEQPDMKADLEDFLRKLID
jgi:UTP--glucose-1-phosphate uridylyltransferase